MDQQHDVATAPPSGAFALTPQQIAFFETFGFLKLPGLFRDEFEEIEAAFEEVFAGYQERLAGEVLHIKDNFLHNNDRHHADPERYIITDFLNRSPRLARLNDDPRVTAVPTALIGDDYESASSDGSLFYCETSWHPDFYGAPLKQLHVKLSFYFEPLRHDSGAIRFLPGTHFHDSPYAARLRKTLFKDPEHVPEAFGIQADEIPSVTVETEPGDAVVWNFRTIHASFHGGARRRLLSINFREPERT